MAEKKKYTEYKNRFNAEKYDSLRVVVPKGRKADVEAHVESIGARSVNGLVNDLLRGELGMTEKEWGWKAVKSDEVPDD